MMSLQPTHAAPSGQPLPYNAHYVILWHSVKILAKFRKYKLLKAINILTYFGVGGKDKLST